MSDHSTGTAVTLARVCYVIEDLLRAIGDEAAAINAGHPSRFRLETLMRAYGVLPYAVEFVATVPEGATTTELIALASNWEATNG
jgi:hypothetical protein